MNRGISTHDPIISPSRRRPGASASAPTPSGELPTAAAPPRHRASRAAKPQPTHEKIAQVAYEIWKERGCPEGDGLSDWLAAEARLVNP